MQDLNPVERRIFDWLSRRSDTFLIVLPMVVFLVMGGIGVGIVSAFFRRSPADSYPEWLIVVMFIGAIALYVSAVVAWTAFFIRTRGFKLLELHQTMRDIRAMSWREFEDLVAASYQARGYDIEPRGGDQPDGGIDLVVRRDGEKWLVQCKHYRNQWVEERPLRELLGVVAASGAAGGVLVTSGVFDESALAFAKGNPKLELVGGEQLREQITRAVQSKYPDPRCPKCASRMLEKTGRYGKFLGCVNYPACHGWRPLPTTTGSPVVKAPA